MRPVSIKIVALLLFILLLVHGIALQFSLYFKFLWLDIPMHFLGGFWVALLFIFLLSKFFPEYCPRGILEKIIMILCAISFVAFIGVLWEFFEYILSVVLNMTMQLSIKDTLGDLLMDILGGLSASLLFVFRKK